MTSDSLVWSLAELAPSVARGRTPLEVVRLAGEGVARLGMSVVALQLVDGEMFVLFVSDDCGIRSATDRRTVDRLFALRARVEPGSAAFRFFANGRSAYEPALDPFTTFFGAKAMSSMRAFGDVGAPASDAVVTPIFVRGLPWGMLVIGSPVLRHEDAAAVGLFAANVTNAIAAADCTQALGRAEDELLGRERLAALGELAATLAHEVRHPLGVLFNSIASLKKIVRRDFDQKARAAAQSLVSILGEETERLDAISSDLLSLARPTTLRKGDVELDQLLRAIARIVPDLAPPAGIEIDLDVALDLPPVLGDERLLHQALLNLVVNAIQAMPEGGTLGLRGHVDFVDGPCAVLEVSDTGTGILPEHQARVFEPFFTTKSNGTGLGLPLVKRIADAHRGRVTVTSDHRGTSFSLRVPLPTEDQSHVTLKREARSVPHLRAVGIAR